MPPRSTAVSRVAVERSPAPLDLLEGEAPGFWPASGAVRGSGARECRLGREHQNGASFRSARPSRSALASAYAGWAGSLPADVVPQRLQQWLRLTNLPPDQWAREWIPGLLTGSAPTEVVDGHCCIKAKEHRRGVRSWTLPLTVKPRENHLKHKISGMISLGRAPLCGAQ